MLHDGKLLIVQVNALMRVEYCFYISGAGELIFVCCMCTSENKTIP